jgi:uncharacterized lipoprotein NlpE involved in copper resistance
MPEPGGRGTAILRALFVVAFTLIGCNARAQINQVIPAQTTPQKQFVPVKQTPLTEKQVQGYLAAIEDINKVTDNAKEDIDKLRPETVAKLDDVSRKHGLASYGDYKQIGDNIGLVSAGLDELTNKYVGREAVIKLRIARVKADKTLSAESRKERLDELNDQLQVALPSVQYKGNIALVTKYSDRLAATMRGD